MQSPVSSESADCQPNTRVTTAPRKLRRCNSTDSDGLAEMLTKPAHSGQGEGQGRSDNAKDQMWTYFSHLHALWTSIEFQSCIHGAGERGTYGGLLAEITFPHSPTGSAISQYLLPFVPHSGSPKQ